MIMDKILDGKKLSEKLLAYKNNPKAILLAIPRGGLEIGYVIAKELNIPLDIILVKKIGYPGNPEYAIGAASLNNVIIDQSIIQTDEFKNYIKKETEKIRKL